MVGIQDTLLGIKCFIYDINTLSTHSLLYTSCQSSWNYNNSERTEFLKSNASIEPFNFSDNILTHIFLNIIAPIIIKDIQINPTDLTLTSKTCNIFNTDLKIVNLDSIINLQQVLNILQ
jgi:hypothetical protein